VSPRVSNSDSIAQHDELRRQFRHVGLVILTLSPGGDLVTPLIRHDDWLTSLFSRSPLLQRALHDAAAQWNHQEHPANIELLPGVWAIPYELKHRKDRVGYDTIIIPTDTILASEQLQALCQTAELDVISTRRMLSDLGLTRQTDMPRIATLVKLAYKDRLLINQHQDTIASMGQQLGESYEEINLLYTIIHSMSQVQTPRRFVSIACEELLETLPYAWIGALLGDDAKRLKRLAGHSFIVGEPPSGSDRVRAAMHHAMERISADAPRVLEPGFRQEHAEYVDLGRTALIHPVSSDGEVIGVLVAGEKTSEDLAASSVDIKLLGATACHLAIFIENAALYEDLNAMFIGTLESLTAAIDAKDRYTCGHSQRVAHLTACLAKAVGLDDERVSRMRMAGLIHDVGKIGIREAVLMKPGRLTRDEFEEIKKHPEIGHRILRDIPQLEDLLPGVLHHHERWDGKGYPYGLAGRDIPSIARFIALADSFDAMSSDRLYRRRLTRQEVLEEIERCAGTQFDPDLVPVFLSLDFTEFDHMIDTHQAADVERHEDQGEQAA
jgi:HD-GYP domain-containing protein (c-di-GMP phosphodiesterase class II)